MVSIKYIDVGELEYWANGTLCIITLKNNHQYAGTATCYDMEKYDKQVARTLAKVNAVNSIITRWNYLINKGIVENEPEIHPEGGRSNQENV